MRFQVLGFDVLLDSKARPWLLEMNDHPSFRIDLSFDEPGQYSIDGLEPSTTFLWPSADD